MPDLFKHPVAAAVLALLIWNLISFAVIGYDKRQARKEGRRVPESTLFLLAALLGAPGLLAGMWRFRHKTQKLSFLIGIPLLILLNFLTIYGIYTLL